MGREKKIFSTTISECVQQDFKAACARQGEAMNTTLERLMTEYAAKVEKEKGNPE